MSQSFLLLLAGPSGVGKSSILRPLLERDPQLVFSISCTTRAPRGDEIDGREYHFLSDAEFRSQRDAGAFVEWAEVHGKLYGTRAADLQRELDAGRIPVLDIDVQGGEQIRARFPGRYLSVFVEPPSWEELERRLRSRGTEDPGALELRLDNARRELAQAPKYQHRLVNDELARAQAELAALVEAEKLRRSAAGPS